MSFVFHRIFDATISFIPHFCEQVWYYLSWNLETLLAIFQAIVWFISIVTYGIFEWVIPLIVAIVLFFVGCFLIFCILVGFVKLVKLAAKKYASLSFDGRHREKSQETNISSHA